MRRLAVAWILLAGCGPGGPRRLGGQPSWRPGQGPTTPSALATRSGPVTFAPPGEPAARYNEPSPPPPRTPLNDAVIAAVQEAAARAGVQVPQADVRLFRACSDLAEIVPDDGSLDYPLIEFALQRNGIIEPSPLLLVVRGDVESPERIVEQLRPRLAELLGETSSARLGVGVARRAADGSGAVVFALQASGVSTRPIPRSVEQGGTIPIDAVIDPRYRDPELLVARENGEVQRIEIRSGRPGGFTAAIPCGAHRGRQQIEIAATGTGGSTVLANFPAWCGASPPSSVTYDPVVDDVLAATTEQAEQRLLASVNGDRIAAGLPVLVWDEHVAEVARGHSADMQRTRSVAHLSPTTGSASDRVRAARIRTSLVLENVARAYGIDEAHQALMNSPGHRANLMSPRATHIGIGVVFGEELAGGREMFITQVFTRVPPRFELSQATRELQGKIQSARPGLVQSTNLATLAQRIAGALSTGSSRDAALAAVKPEIEGLGKHYLRFGSVITALADLESVDGGGLLQEAHGNDFGLGVAQGPHPEIGDQAIWLVIVIASRRP